MRARTNTSPASPSLAEIQNAVNVTFVFVLSHEQGAVSNE
jgi:hypothetical protein